MRESPEDPDDPASTSFPYRRGGLTLSGSGAALAGEDATALVLNGTTGYASATGPVVDETGSFTVSARVRLNKALLAAKPVGYRGLVAGQATPVGKESSWALWVEKPADGVYQWRFGRTAVDSTGKVIDTALAPAEAPVGDKEWDTWVDVSGVFDATKDFAAADGYERFGVAELYVGQFVQRGEEDPGFPCRSRAAEPSRQDADRRSVDGALPARRLGKGARVDRRDDSRTGQRSDRAALGVGAARSTPLL